MMTIQLYTVGAFVVCSLLAYFIGWRHLGKRFEGVGRHLVRAVIFAILLGPFLILRLHDLLHLERFFGRELPAVCEYIWVGLPGFLLAGGTAFIISSFRELKKNRVALTISFLITLLLVNWYVAGIPRRLATLTYTMRSRPGTINLMNESMLTPLAVAATHERDFDLMARIVSLGGDVNATVASPHGRTIGEMPDSHLLYWVAGDGDVDVARFLIDQGAIVDIENVGGRTPLHFAAEQMHVDMASFLISRKADVNARIRGLPDKRREGLYSCDHDSATGRTPLHLAAASRCSKPDSRDPVSCNTKMCELLIGNGADPNALDYKNETPLYHAALLGNYEIFEYLLNHGSDPKLITAENINFLKSILLIEGDERHSRPGSRCGLGFGYGPGSRFRNYNGLRRVMKLLKARCQSLTIDI